MPRRLCAADRAQWAEFDDLDPNEADDWFAALVVRLGEPDIGDWSLLASEAPNQYAISYALNWKIDFGGDFAMCEPWLEHFRLIGGAGDAAPWRDAGWGSDDDAERSPKAAGIYDEAGATPDEADRWVAAGYLPEQAAKFIAAGVSVEEAQSEEWNQRSLDTMIALRGADLA